VTQPAMNIAPLPLAWTCTMHGDYPSAVDEGRRQQFDCPDCDRAFRDTMLAWRRAWSLHKRWHESGIPDRYLNRTFDNFRLSPANKVAVAVARRFAEQFPTQYDHGTGLLLAGDLGTGKTHLAVATLTEIIRMGRTGAFIAVTELLAAMKRGYSGEVTDTNALSKVDLLVLDDVGATRGTEWEVAALADLLGTRYDDQLPTIITTNAPDLAAFVGDRTVDRFAESMLTARLTGESYRSKVPDDDALRAAPWAIPQPPLEFKAERCLTGKMRTTRYQMTDRGEEKLA
jgi:DNA replication protein DnaC